MNYMRPWQPEARSDILVDAIEEGKIVKVTEDYAIKENLPILRKHEKKPEVQKKSNDPENLFFEDLRRPLNYKKSQVLSDLIDNFQWEIAKKRKALGMSRRMLAEQINETELSLKLIENGMLPKDDFVIINKIQSRLGINLRKDKQDMTKSARSLLDKDSPPPMEESNKNPEPITGDDVEIIDEE